MHVLITGATGGIGTAVAELLASLGFDLTLVARDPARLAALAAKLRRVGVSVTEIAATLDSHTDFAALKEQAWDGNGPIDILINNAAINWFGHFTSMPDHDIEALIATDIVVPIRMTRAVIGDMQRGGEGIIVNIGSVFGSIGFAGFAVYSACKFAMRGFSEALRRELRGSGISVLYVAPRYTRTGFNEGAVERMARAAKMTVDEPAVVARHIVEAIIKKRPETIIGGSERIFAKLNGLIPRVVDRGMVGKSRRALAFAPGTAVKFSLEEEKK